MMALGRSDTLGKLVYPANNSPSPSTTLTTVPNSETVFTRFSVLSNIPSKGRLHGYNTVSQEIT